MYKNGLIVHKCNESQFYNKYVYPHQPAGRTYTKAISDL